MSDPIRDNFVMLFGVIFSVVGCFILEPIVIRALRFLCVFTVVREREAQVFVLFGSVLGTIREPGLHFLWALYGPKAILIPFAGRVYSRDLSIDQEYLRSTPVNSEEGAPMGIGVWFEMVIIDPVAHIFRNAEPRGSLSTNVGNATVRALSNMKLAEMLENRHRMSIAVRQSVSTESREWGYEVGSVYIRKVHFRDEQMTRQIEAKVINRLRQVTSAITQDGTNQVNIIRSRAEREAAGEFARAAGIRMQVVGMVLNKFTQSKDIAEGLLEILEIQTMRDSGAELTLIPEGLKADLLLSPGISGAGVVAAK